MKRYKLESKDWLNAPPPLHFYTFLLPKNTFYSFGMPGFKPLFAALDSPAVAVAVQISLMLHFWTWNVIYSGSYSWCQLESIKSFPIKEKFWLTWRHLSNCWGGRLERGPLFLWAQRHQLAHATKIWRSWYWLGISIYQFCILYFVSVIVFWLAY